MTLLEIEVTNWCQIEHLLVQFNPSGRCHLIRGKNNGGKTNLLRAICFAFDLTRGQSAFGSIRSINRHNKADKAVVRVKFSEADKVHEIERTLTKKKGGNIVKMDGVEKPLTEAAAIFQNEWGCTHPEQLLSLLILPQGRTDLLVRESGSVREERLGKIKGLHRIKTKIAELDKQRKALKAQREALAAEGIVTIEKEDQLVVTTNEIANQQTAVEALTKKLLSPEKKEHLTLGVLWHRRQALLQKEQELLGQLPAWVRKWAEQFRTDLVAGTAVGAAEMIRKIKESVQNEEHNLKVSTKQTQLKILLSTIPVEDSKKWSLFPTAVSAAAAYEKEAQQLGYRVEGAPTPEDFKLWATYAAQATLAPNAEELEAQRSKNGNGPLPYEDTVQALHGAFGRYGLPTLCPISDQPITPEGVENAKKKAQARRSAGEKNAAVTAFLNKAKTIPSLKDLATVDRLSELLNLVRTAKTELTPERQTWRRQEEKVKNLRLSHQAAQVAHQNAIAAYPDWANLEGAQKEVFLQKLSKAEALRDLLYNLGPQRATIPERIEEAQEPLFLQLDQTYRAIQQITQNLTNEEEAAKAASENSIEQITAILKEQEKLSTEHATKTGELAATKKRKTDIEAEIERIKRRKIEHDLKKDEEEAYSEAVDFLQPGNGPREIIRLDLEDALAEANERLSDMGVDLVLECDQELQIFAGTAEEMVDPETRTEGELLGMGLGALAGAFLHAALLRQFNDSVATGKVENLILDEPTAFLRPHIKPGFYQSLALGKNRMTGLIMVEHERIAESFSDGITSFGDDT